MDTLQFTQLIEANLPLVRHVVFQVSVRFPSHVDRAELARAGVLGLVQAAHRYDAGKGVRFSRFAAQRIRGAILDAARSVDWAPRSVRRAARAVEVTAGQLANDLGRTPTAAETAAALGITPRQLADLQEQVVRSVVLTLDMAVTEGDDDEITLGDTVVDGSASAPEDLEQRELHAYLRDAVDLLPERHRRVIQGYFFDGSTSEELAAELGVSVSRISQLRADAFSMLREGITAQYAESGTETVDVPEAQPAPTVSQRRKAAYAKAIAARRDWRSRLQDEGGQDLRSTATRLPSPAPA